MINLEVNDWYEAWEKVHKILDEDPDAYIDQRFATRGVSFNNSIKVKTNHLGKLSKELVGYTSYKTQLFDRNYVLPGKKEEIGQLLVERCRLNRKLTTVSYSFNIDNKSHSQGPCVINILIVMYKVGKVWNIRFQCHMRIAEITRRLLVDYIKFYEIIQYWLDELKDYNTNIEFIEFSCPVIYAEPLAMTMATVSLEVRYEKDHWLHRAIQRQLTIESDQIKFKRGKRIKKNLKKIKEIQL
jgi:hypothetical protein